MYTAHNKLGAKNRVGIKLILQPQSWKEPSVDGCVHLASTDNVFATSLQGSSPNTAPEILMEQLFFPRQAFKT
jgi:hypothetical protein